ncbi:MAG TPA: FdrA family protein [Nocardioidaceae bacterium]|nr:FdrA family protein [Nocardioidaceae bacterium]
MNVAVKVFRDTYVDSVVQLQGIRAMREIDGVEWASAAMATPANVATLKSEGVDPDAIHDAGSNDFFLVARGSSDEVVAAALATGEAAVRSTSEAEDSGEREVTARSLRDATRRQADSNVAVISVPGDYATLAAYEALSSDLHVLLFSDNVPLDKEIALKDYALDRERLLMGPGAGTAMLGGTGLGFANVVRPGRVGVVAAAGTGAQEAMSLLDRWGVGVTQVIGVGGRDLSSAVGGRMSRAAIKALRDDPATEVILLVSKPPSPDVAADVLATAGDKPLVAALIGLDPETPTPPGVVLAGTLETGVTATLAVLGVAAPDTVAIHGPSIDQVRRRLSPGRSLIRGLFSGGTLCYESLTLLGRIVGEVRSNTPINPEWGLPAPPGSHQCLDLGEEEYTRGRPHPMIDPEARVDLLREHGADPDVAAIILDVVLGYGSNDDPAAIFAPVCRSVMADGGPQVLAYVLGTEGDPQGFAGQRDQLVEAGCIVTETAARATLAAAAVATGDQSLLGMRL